MTASNIKVDRRFYFIVLAVISIAGINLAAEQTPSESLLGEERVLPLGSWIGSKLDITDSIVIEGHNYCCFTVHEVNPTGTNHLAYTFYLIADPELGDVQGIMDYNINGCHPDLNLNIGNTGGSDGSYPGRHLKWAVNLVNDHYDENFGAGVEQGEAVFCILGGDLAVSAEKSELQHANRKLAMLHMPWVPIIGNHDTWPYADIYDSWRSDYYFQAPSVFGSRFSLAGNIFPNWQKQSLPSGVDSSTTPATRCQNWAFDLGPTHVLGLDFTIRSFGGVNYLGTLHNNDNGTWPWLCDHLDNQEQDHERLIIAAHHPLNKTQFPTQVGTIVDLIDNHEDNVTYWFCGHEHKDPDKYWAVGPSNNDTVIEVHFNSGTNRGNTEGNDFHIALVEVYSDYVCDFTLSPNPTTTEKEVTFTSTSHFYSAPSICKYYWDFGDGSAVYSSTSNETYHTYPEYGDYWAKHWVEDISGSQRSYMIRKIKVEPPLNPPHLWVTIKPPFQPQGGLMSYLSAPGGGGAGDYLAHLKWTFYPVHPYPYTFVNYTGGRVAPNTNSFIQWNDPSDHGWADDPEPLFIGNLYTWRINANLTSTIENDTTLYDYDYKDLRDDPEPPGGCPEACSYFRCDTTGGDSTHLFLPENTLFPHSEHYAEIRADYLKLDHLTSHTGHYYLNIVENDNETSYIDEAKLWAIDHPEGTEVATSSDGEIYIYSDIATPLSCFDNEMNDRYDEIFFLDDDAFMGNNSSYLTATFPTQDWGNRGLLLGTGIPSGGSEAAPMPKNYLGIPKKPDGGGGWIPMGEAFARKEPSLWMFDVSDIQDNTFRIDCSGDSCYINYVALVKLEPDEFILTEAPLDSAVRWDHYDGSWSSSNALQHTHQTDSVFVVLDTADQLALRYDTVTTTTFVRDFVLQTSGFYVPDYVQGQGQSGSEEEKLVFKLEVQQLEPLTGDVSIRYTLPYPTRIKIRIYDVGGRLVNKLVDGEIPRGSHELTWKGKDPQGHLISNGVYFIKMNADEFEKQQKIVVLR